MAFVDNYILTNKVTNWAASYSACVVYILIITIILFTSVSMKVVDIYLHFGEQLSSTFLEMGDQQPQTCNFKP